MAGTPSTTGRRGSTPGSGRASSAISTAFVWSRASSASRALPARKRDWAVCASFILASVRSFSDSACASAASTRLLSSSDLRCAATASRRAASLRAASSKAWYASHPVTTTATVNTQNATMRSRFRLRAASSAALSAAARLGGRGGLDLAPLGIDAGRLLVPAGADERKVQGRGLRRARGPQCQPGARPGEIVAGDEEVGRPTPRLPVGGALGKACVLAQPVEVGLEGVGGVGQARDDRSWRLLRLGFE